MPRRPRVFVDGAIYHVYCRFAHGARVFAEEDEARRFLATLGEVARTDELSILAWCLMPTHYHLAVRTARLPLWRSLRVIQGRYALGHNRRWHTVGPLWQGRYKARLVDGQEDVQRLLAYVHINPVKAGLAGTPDAYPWSGHRELLGRVSAPVADVDATLRLFGEGRAAARRAYSGLVRAAGKDGWSAEGPGALPWWRREAREDEVLGASHGGPIVDALGATTAPPRLRASLEDVLAVVGRATGVDAQRLASGVRDRLTVEARRLVAVLAVHRCGHEVQALARRLGKSADTVSRWVTRGAQRRVSDAAVRGVLDRLEAELRVG